MLIASWNVLDDVKVCMVSFDTDGGTGPYTYTIKLYNASGLIKEVTEVKDNKLFVASLGSGQYYAKFTIWDAEGNKYSGSIPIVKITANF